MLALEKPVSKVTNGFSHTVSQSNNEKLIIASSISGKKKKKKKKKKKNVGKIEKADESLSCLPTNQEVTDLSTDGHNHIVNSSHNEKVDFQPSSSVTIGINDKKKMDIISLGKNDSFSFNDKNVEADSKIIRGVNFVYPRKHGDNKQGYGTTSFTAINKEPVPYIFAKRRQIESELTASFNYNTNEELEKKREKKEIKIEAVRDKTIEEILFPTKYKVDDNDKKKIKPSQSEEKESFPKGLSSDDKNENEGSNTEQNKKLKSAEKSSVKNIKQISTALEKNKNDATNQMDVAKNTKNEAKTISVLEKKSVDANDLSSQNEKIPQENDDKIVQSSKQKTKAKPGKDLKTRKRQRSISEDFTQDQIETNQQLSGITVEDAIKDKFGRRPRSNSTDGELNLPRRGLCDERMVLESHKWNLTKFSNGSSKKLNSVPRGLVNLGNTCFLNATLQCLVYLPTFCQCVAAVDVSHSHYNLTKKQKNKSKVSIGKRLTLALRSLVRKAHGLDGNRETTKPIAPNEIVRAVPLLGGSSRGYKFRPGRQEDAHEFLVHLLDAMNDGELKAAGINLNKSGWRDRLPIPRLDETTFIHRMFGGYLRSQVHCTRCGHNSNTYDPFLDLSLEVSKKSCTSISAAFADFTRKETLDTENKYQCSSCKKRVCATKQLTVFRPPLSLCIQLKRFTFGAGSIGGLIYNKGGFGYGHFAGKGMKMRGGGKIQKPIDFPESLRLPLSDGRKCEYELTGLIIHVGGSATSGHYTAYVKKPGAEKKHCWFHMDDSFVQTVSNSTVLQQRDAYVLFYCRKEVQLELPKPPPRVSMTAEDAIEVSKARAKSRAALDTKKASLSISRKEAEKHSVCCEKANDVDSGKTKKKKKKKKETAKKETTESELNVPTPPIQDDNGEIRDLLSNGGGSDDSETDDSSSSSSDSASHSSSQNLKKVKKSLDSAMAKTVILTGNTNQVKPSNQPEMNGNNHALIDDNNNSIRKTLPKSSKKTLKVDRGLGRGTVEVIIEKRKKSKSWQPVSFDQRNNVEGLLVNKNIEKWDDEPESQTSLFRKRLNEELNMNERKRKKKMYLDNWDAKLDEGRRKKVKSDKSLSDDGEKRTSKTNLFQQIAAKKHKEKKLRFGGKGRGQVKSV